MSTLDTNPKVLQLAYDLGLPWQSSPVQEIINHCLAKLRSWLPAKPPSIEEVERIICQKLSLVIIEVYTDEELTATIKKYVDLGELVFAGLRSRLDNWTYAELIRLGRTYPDHPELNVAIIDCRNQEKFSKRFFSRWHEIAHLLTLVPQMGIRFNRSSSDRCPIERLMDKIAAETAFYEPIFRPILTTESANYSRPCFAMIETVRQQYRPEASLHSTALAVINRIHTPAVFVEASLALKKEEMRRSASRQQVLFPETAPTARLRATDVTPNAAAREMKLRINPNMRVPEDSAIWKAFYESDGAREVCGVENLSTWTTSDGSTLRPLQVHIESRKLGNVVQAIVTPK